MANNSVIAIVLNYNDYKNTYDFVSVTQKYISIDKIIIVDNCSTDDSYEKLLNDRFDKKVEIIRTKFNSGYGSGNNFGIRYAEQKYNPEFFIISNPDIEVKNATIERIISFLQRTPEASSASGLIHTSEGEIAKNFSWIQPSLRDVLLDSSFSLKIFAEKVLKKSNRYNVKKIKYPFMKVDVLSGCFFIVKADKLKNVNYFDESTFLYHEENILFGKLNKKYSQFVLTNEKVIHHQGGSISQNIKNWKVKSDWLIESGSIYLEKNLKVNSFYRQVYVQLSKVLRYERFVSLFLKEKLVLLNTLLKR